ncbi:hypothetical protein HDV04_000071 [Boothiomyces sp. JEL0838]|nr:hypothetical protein HDV04_000071 [Boothiomyces sp. JEL0838]
MHIQVATCLLLQLAAALKTTAKPPVKTPFLPIPVNPTGIQLGFLHTTRPVPTTTTTEAPPVIITQIEVIPPVPTITSTIQTTLVPTLANRLVSNPTPTDIPANFAPGSNLTLPNTPDSSHSETPSSAIAAGIIFAIVGSVALALVSFFVIGPKKQTVAVNRPRGPKTFPPPPPLPVYKPDLEKFKAKDSLHVPPSIKMAPRQSELQIEPNEKSFSIVTQETEIERVQD